MAPRRLRLLSYMVGGFPLSLFERIAGVMDVELEYDESRSGPIPGDHPFADGRADFGWICSTSYVDLALGVLEPTVRLAGVGWVPLDEASTDRAVYFGDVVVNEDSPVRNLGELRDATIGCNDEVSLSGHYSLRFALQQRGLDPASFAKLRFTGGHHNSLDALVDNQLDAAVVDSIVRTTRARADDRVARLRVVERLGPWPVQPLVASVRLSAEDVRQAQTALLASNDDPAMQSELHAAGLARFVPVDDDHYAPVRHAFAQFDG